MSSRWPSSTGGWSTNTIRDRDRSRSRATWRNWELMPSSATTRTCSSLWSFIKLEEILFESCRFITRWGISFSCFGRRICVWEALPKSPWQTGLCPAAGSESTSKAQSKRASSRRLTAKAEGPGSPFSRRLLQCPRPRRSSDGCSNFTHSLRRSTVLVADF